MLMNLSGTKPVFNKLYFVLAPIKHLKLFMAIHADWFLQDSYGDYWIIIIGYFWD